MASTTSNSTAETVDPPSAFTETGGGGDDDEGAEVVAAQLPHVKRHFLAAFLHFFAFFRHWSVGHMPGPFGMNSLLIFFVHLLAFHLSWQAASVRFTLTAAARATSSALRISTEAGRRRRGRRRRRPPQKWRPNRGENTEHVTSFLSPLHTRQGARGGGACIYIINRFFLCTGLLYVLELETSTTTPYHCVPITFNHAFGQDSVRMEGDPAPAPRARR